MPTLAFNTDNGVIQITTVYKCIVCGTEIENFLDSKPHVDENPNHYFTMIFR